MVKSRYYSLPVREFHVIIPVFGEADLAERSIDSALAQDFLEKKITVCFDQVDERRERELCEKYPDGVSFIKSEISRLYALQNIFRALEFVDKNSIVGIIDGDDELIRDDTFSLIAEAYEKGAGCVWTAHSWDINGVNQSAALDDSKSPYTQKWASSHFRTFLKEDLDQVNPANFKDQNNLLFKRTYDQVLMLPILSKVLKSGRPTKYIEKVCYLYRGRTEWGTEGNKYQLDIERFIRQRGYIE